MKNCTDIRPISGCFKPNDGSPSVPVIIHVIYDKDEVAVGQAYTLASNNEVIIDPALFMGGGEVFVGDCVNKPTECRESQEWTYGIDNTGTRFNDVAEYLITLSDGSTLTFSQDGSSGSWTQQLTEWSNNIQTAADAAGLAWFVEPRFIDFYNVTNLDGTINGPGGTPSGLPGAPSEPVAVALDAGGMRWRYVNIQICPGQPVPIAAERTGSATYTNNPFQLTTAGAVLGPINKFKVCTDCADQDEWKIFDKSLGEYREASLGEIPNCWEPCGTLALAESPPDRSCEFFFDLACDSNNETDILLFTNQITRRATVCSGEQIAVDYFTEDPNDPAALIDYTLVGEFVDCDTGEIVPEILPPCSDFVEATYYKTVNFTLGLRNREWVTTDPLLPQSDIDANNAYIDSFDFSISPTTDTIVTSNVGFINDTDNSAGVLDFQIREGYIRTEEPLIIRWSTNSEGTILVDLGLCCDDYNRVLEYSKGVGGLPSESITIPTGTHKIRIYNIDSGGSNSSWNPQVSLDGIDFVTDNTVFDDIVSHTKPSEKCISVKICKDSGAIINILTGEVINDLSELSPCSLACESDVEDCPTSTVQTTQCATEEVPGNEGPTCSFEQTETQTINVGPELTSVAGAFIAFGPILGGEITDIISNCPADALILLNLEFNGNPVSISFNPAVHWSPFGGGPQIVYENLFNPDCDLTGFTAAGNPLPSIAESYNDLVAVIGGESDAPLTLASWSCWEQVTSTGNIVDIGDEILTVSVIDCSGETLSSIQQNLSKGSVQLAELVATQPCTDPAVSLLTTIAQQSEDAVIVDCSGTTQTEVYDSDVRIVGAKNPIPVFVTETCPNKVEVDYEYICNEDTNLYDLHTIVTTNGVAAPAVITPTTTSCDEDPDFEERVVCDSATETLHSLLLEIDEDGNFVTLSDLDLFTPCEPKQVDCVESQEYTYAIDNTGTQTNEDATLTITLSDGTELVIDQTNQGAASQWTPQMQEWGTNIQAAADDAGLAWFVETRCILGATNPAGCGGFSGPPSEVVGKALWAGNIRARYVNIQICPGQPVPVRAVYNSVARPNLQMTTAGAVLGPLKKFFVCRSCGDEPVWYLEDGITLATAGQIPNCWEPCGTLTLADGAPDRDCEFEYQTGCDNLNQNNINNFVQITRRSTICAGDEIAVDYFIEEQVPERTLVTYNLVGEFVDCATGEVIPEIPVDGVIIDCDGTIQAESYDQDVRIVGAKNPIPVYQVAQCGDYIRTEDVKLCEVDARFLLLIDSGGVFARYSFITEAWEEVTTLSVASAGGSADVANFKLYNFVAPDQLTTVDLNTDTQLPNVTVIDGVINPAVATNPKTFSAASFRDADGKLYAQDTAGADAGLYCINPVTGVVDFVTAISGVAGAGTSIAIDNTTDTLYVNGSNFSYEVDWVTGVGIQAANPPIQPNGSTFDTDGNWYVTQGNNTYVLPAGADGNDPSNWNQIIDDFGAGANSIAYYEVEAQKPSCFFRRYGILANGDREVIGDFQVTDDSPRTVVGEVDCCECGCGSDSSSGGTGTTNQCEDNIVQLTTQTGTGNIPAGFKSVTINNLTGVTTINGGFELGTGRRVDSISFGTDRGNCVNETLPAYTIAGNGTHQWIGHL